MNNMSTYIREARQAAGMDWPVTSHTSHKTAATIWHDSGVLTDRQKADLTGHAKISTRTDIYVAREAAPLGAAVKPSSPARSCVQDERMARRRCWNCVAWRGPDSST
jgi:integrase